MTPTRKELQLVLKVTTDPDGSGKRGMEQVAAAAERAERATTRAERAARTGGVAGGGGGGKAASGFFAGAGEMLAARFGVTPGIAGPAMAAAAAVQVARTSKAAGDAYRDELLTENQRARAIVRSVPFGDTALSYLGTITGRDRDMARAQEEGQVNAARSQAESQLYGQQLSLRAGAMTSRAEANALRGAQAGRLAPTDRTSAAGEREYRFRSQILSLDERSATAKRAAETAQEGERNAAKQLAEIQGKILANDTRRAAIGRQLGRMGEGRTTGQRVGAAIIGGLTGAFLPEALDLDGPARKRLLDEQATLQGARADLTGQAAAAEQRRADMQRRGIAAAADQARFGKDGPEQLRAQAGLLEERAGRAMSAAERIGTSDPDSRMEAMFALRRLKSRGIENLDPAEIAAARAFAPETVSRLAREAGRRSPQYDVFRQLADPGDYPTERPEDDYRRAGELNQRARQGELDIQGRAAEQGAKVAEAMADAIVAILRANIPTIIEQVRTSILQGRLGGTGST